MVWGGVLHSCIVYISGLDLSINICKLYIIYGINSSRFGSEATREAVGTTFLQCVFAERYGPLIWVCFSWAE